MTKMYLFFYFVNIYVKHVEDRDFLFSSVQPQTQTGTGLAAVMIGQQHTVYSIFSSRHADSNNLFYVLCHMILCEARLSSRVCSIDD